MRQLLLNLPPSLDGFIADQDDGIDWIAPPPDDCEIPADSADLMLQEIPIWPLKSRHHADSASEALRIVHSEPMAALGAHSVLVVQSFAHFIIRWPGLAWLGTGFCLLPAADLEC